MRLVLTSEHAFRWVVITSIAGMIGCTSETLRSWVNKMEVDSGTKSGVGSMEAARMKELERQNRELKRGARF